MYLVPATACAAPITPRVFLASEITAAAKGVAELTQKHPSWPAARVRAQVARQLNVSTVQLRYLLRQASN